MYVLDNDAEKCYLNCLRMSVLIKAQDNKVLNENLKNFNPAFKRSEEMTVLKDLLLWSLHPDSCSVQLTLHSSYEKSFGVKAVKVESQFHPLLHPVSVIHER